MLIDRGTMLARIDVLDFEIDYGNESKFWTHGLTREAVAQVLRNHWVLARNRKHRSAQYLLIGRDHSGRCIAIPIVPTHDPDVWRPVSAWPCKRSEAAKLG
jgi:hypothetical protein